MDENAIYMDRTIELALMGSGWVNPDPLSAAVLVKDHRIISESFHFKYNRLTPIAMEAILKATEDINHSELYLNIEPYLDSHLIQEFAETILFNGVLKIHIGMENPHPDIQGKVIAMLRERGIGVELGLLQEKCEELNEIYSHYIIHGTPFVFVKWAMTLDGKLATQSGDSKWISGDESLLFVHRLRQRVAAIMVGEGTVKADNPSLTTRLEGVEISNPLRVILSKYGDVDENAKVLQVDEVTRTVLIASTRITQEKENWLLKKGVTVVKLEETEKQINFLEILKVLGELQIDSLFIEGGSSVLGSAFDSGIVNKVYTTIAPKIIGGRYAMTPVGGQGIKKMRDALQLKNVSYEIVGNDVIVKGYVK